MQIIACVQKLFSVTLTSWPVKDNRYITCARSRWVCEASPSPPTFPVVLSGRQVDGQVNDGEQSPALRHADDPPRFTLTHKWTSRRTEDKNSDCRVLAFLIPSFTVFIFLLPPPSIHPLPPLPLFLFSQCVCSPLRPGCLLSHLETIRFWVAPALSPGLFSQLPADCFSYWATLHPTG